MEIIIYSFIVLIISVVIFLTIVKPYKLLAILVFMMLYQFNYATPLPLDTRGLLLLILFFRLYLFDRENMRITNAFLFGNVLMWLIVIFTLSILSISLINNEVKIGEFRDIILAFILVIVGFISVRKKEGQISIIYGVILSAVISSIDLIYTFFMIRTDSIMTVKLPNLLLGHFIRINHNYPGYLSSMGLLFVYLAWNHTKFNRSILFSLLVLLSIGVFLSTSRSAILAFLIVIVLLSIFDPVLKNNLKTIIKTAILFIIFLVGFYIIYNTILIKSGNTYYVDKMYYRLIEEPLQTLSGSEAEEEFDPWTGKKISGSIDFRSKTWLWDLKRFGFLSLDQQIFGLGPNGYLQVADIEYNKYGNIRNQLPPHNGYILIVLERGLFGLLLFVIILVYITYSAIRVSRIYPTSFPFIYLLLTIAIYALGQNAELTDTFAYFIFGCVIGNIVYPRLQQNKNINKESVRFQHT